MSEKDNTVKTTACELTFKSNRIVHAHFDAGRVVNEEDVDEMFQALKSVSNGQRNMFLVTVADGTTLSNEARSVISSDDANKYIVADAIVVRDFQHQLSANAFIRHNKPSRPVQTFETMDEALEWLESHRGLLDSPA